jgi:S-adenosylmethionine hydrolase
VGPPLPEPVKFALEPVRQHGPGEWRTRVLHVDRFGNLTTHLGARDMDAILASVGGPTGIVVLVEGIVVPFVRTYADVPEGDPCALMGSSGRLEVAVHRASASRLLGAGKGAPVWVRAVSATGG